MQIEGVETEISTDTSATESFMPQGGTTPDAHRGSRDRDAHGRLGDGAPSYDGLHVCQWEWRGFLPGSAELTDSFTCQQ
jgi:hypothetical protein